MNSVNSRREAIGESPSRATDGAASRLAACGASSPPAFSAFAAFAGGPETGAVTEPSGSAFAARQKRFAPSKPAANLGKCCDVSWVLDYSKKCGPRVLPPRPKCDQLLAND